MKRAVSQVKYTQLTVECSGCPARILNNNDEIMNALRITARACKLTVLKEDSHRFLPQGITGYVLLGESHISIHTWPEERFALVDILSCSYIDTDTVIRCLQRCLRATAISVSSHLRRMPERTVPQKAEGISR